jgi:hypothetical protein
MSNKLSGKTVSVPFLVNYAPKDERTPFSIFLNPSHGGIKTADPLLFRWEVIHYRLLGKAEWVWLPFPNIFGRLGKEQSGLVPGGLLTSKPTWWNTSGCSPTSAFFWTGLWP